MVIKTLQQQQLFPCSLTYFCEYLNFEPLLISRQDSLIFQVNNIQLIRCENLIRSFFPPLYLNIKITNVIINNQQWVDWALRSQQRSHRPPLSSVALIVFLCNISASVEDGLYGNIRGFFSHTSLLRCVCVCVNTSAVMFQFSLSRWDGTNRTNRFPMFVHVVRPLNSSLPDDTVWILKRFLFDGRVVVIVVVSSPPTPPLRSRHLWRLRLESVKRAAVEWIHFLLINCHICVFLTDDQGEDLSPKQTWHVQPAVDGGGTGGSVTLTGRHRGLTWIWNKSLSVI